MERTMNTICVKGTFHGIYKWGEGWSEQTCFAWRRAWNDTKYGSNGAKRAIFWNYCRTDNTDYLVGTAGSIFLHPMDFKAVLSSNYDRDFASELKELKELCEYVVAECGGTFTLEVSDVQEVRFSMKEV